MAQDAQKVLIMVDPKLDDEKLSVEIAKRMATEIRAIKKRNGNCLPQDLNDVGFTPQEVVDHWETAYSLVTISKTQNHLED